MVNAAAVLDSKDKNFYTIPTVLKKGWFLKYLRTGLFSTWAKPVKWECPVTQGEK